MEAPEGQGRNLFLFCWSTEEEKEKKSLGLTNEKKIPLKKKKQQSCVFPDKMKSKTLRKIILVKLFSPVLNP